MRIAVRAKLLPVILGLFLNSVLVTYSWSDPVDHPVAVLTEKFESLDLVPYLFYYHDTQGMSLEQVQNLLAAGSFSSLKISYPNIGFVEGSHWFHFAIKNAAPREQDILLELDYSYLDRVEFYCFGATAAVDYYLLGDHVAYGSRYLKVRNYVVPLEIPVHGIRHCLVRVESRSHIALPIRAYNRNTFIEDSQRFEKVLGILYGVALALLIYNLIQYAILRERIHLYFAIHVVGGVSYMTFIDGSLSSLWISLGLQDSGVIVAICICAIGAIKFSSDYLQLQINYPVLHRIGNFSVGLAVVMSLVSIVSASVALHILVTVYALVASCYLVLCGVLRAADRFKPAVIYLYGFGLVFLTVIWTTLNIFIFKADVRWIIYGINLVWVGELIVWSVALNDRVRKIEQEHLLMEAKFRAMKNESQTKTDFIAKVSHEVRTPINGLLGLVELLLTTPLNRDQQRYMSAIQKAGKGLLAVINDVLDFSQIEAGKMTLTNSAFDLSELLNDACAIYEFDARLKSLELGCVIAPGTPLQLVGDATRIRQIILNTLSNAIKYTDHGYVHINVQLTDHIHNDRLLVRFEVEDSGVGISESDQHKLFQSYTQLGQARQHSGSGLGLVISRQLVELMDGEMGVKSDLGAGSCVWFNIPLQLAENAIIADGAIMLDLFSGDSSQQNSIVEQRSLLVSKVEKFASENAVEVLVVEDNEINRSVISGFLEKMNIRCDLADNGRSAVNKVKSEAKYDLILMDCDMPVMDGYEAAAKILKWQQSMALLHTPIIALSAHAMDEHKKMAFDSGMVDYICKPISFNQLEEKIRPYLDSLKASEKQQ